MPRPPTAPPRLPPALPGLLAVVLGTALGLGLLAVRSEWTGRPALGFLPWNLLLAWAPYVLALGARALLARGRGRAGVLLPFAAAWLLLLPNAPYLLTDLIHLRPRAGVPPWFDAALLALFAATGWLLGLLSLEVWVAALAARVGRWAAGAGLVVTCALCGYGVYLGRVERWNSWDVLRAPGRLARAVWGHVQAPLAHPGLVGMSALFALLLLASFAGLALLRHAPGERTPSASG